MSGFSPSFLNAGKCQVLKIKALSSSLAVENELEVVNQDDRSGPAFKKASRLENHCTCAHIQEKSVFNPTKYVGAKNSESSSCYQNIECTLTEPKSGCDEKKCACGDGAEERMGRQHCAYGDMVIVNWSKT